jgi:hypothetical protein
MERAYRNLGYFLLALLPIFIAGFWIPYLSEIPVFDPSITPPVHVHAVLLFGWISLFIQPLAIRYGAFSAHRLLGRASYVVMALNLLIATAVASVRPRGFLPWGLPDICPHTSPGMACSAMTGRNRATLNTRRHSSG